MNKPLHDSKLHDRILANCIPEPNTGCWLWLGADVADGYGQVRVEGPKVRVHRAMYIACHGPVSPDLVVRHRCDVTACCNPQHLTIGTQKENVADCIKRGRRADSRGRGSKLTAEDVLAIRDDRRVYRLIAEDYGIVKNTVQAIKARRIWSHLS